MRPSTANRGFTLIELLVVISVIVTLVSMLMTAIPLVRNQAMTAKCASQLRQVGLGCEGYSQNHEGFYPWSIPNPNFYNWLATFDGSPHGLGCLYPDYVDSRLTYSCPSMPLTRGSLVFRTRQDMVLRYAGYRYNGNQWTTPDLGTSFGAPASGGGIGVGNGFPKGPNILIGTSGTTGSARGNGRTVLAFDQMVENDTDWRGVIHLHPFNRETQPANSVPLVNGGNVLYVDGHVSFLRGSNWALTGGANNNYVPKIGF